MSEGKTRKGKNRYIRRRVRDQAEGRCIADGCHGRIPPFAPGGVDPLTHTLLGASAAYAVFGRRLGRTAAGAGALAAFAPDADVFIRSAVDPLVAIEHHRGFTHALAFAPVGAAVVAALWLFSPGWRSRHRWPLLWLCCTVAYLTHPLLDASTTYGTQLFWPFSTVRIGWDAIAIIDPIFTAILCSGLAVALLRQRVGATRVALLLAAGYVGWGFVQHARALAAQRTLAAGRGHIIERAEAMPTLGNNIVWRALYLHEGRIHSDRLRVGWFSAPQVREGWSLPVVRRAHLTAEELARDRQRSFERFAWFSDHWVARSPADATVLADMRYSLSAEAFDPIWGIRFLGPDATSDIAWVNRSRERRIAPGELWREIVGRDPRFTPLAGPTPSGTPAPATSP
jgi:inner membrane protein